LGGQPERNSGEFLDGFGRPARFVVRTSTTGSPLVFNHATRDRGWIFDGGNSNGIDWPGSHGWTPMMIEIGPISQQATIISFGFVLSGSGDVWLYDPRFEAVTSDDPYRRRGDVYVIGSDRDSPRTRGVRTK
jgi:hypothetical protein